MLSNKHSLKWLSCFWNFLFNILELDWPWVSEIILKVDSSIRFFTKDGDSVFTTSMRPKPVQREESSSQAGIPRGSKMLLWCPSVLWKLFQLLKNIWECGWDRRVYHEQGEHRRTTQEPWGKPEHSFSIWPKRWPPLSWLLHRGNETLALMRLKSWRISVKKCHLPPLWVMHLSLMFNHLW